MKQVHLYILKKRGKKTINRIKLIAKCLYYFYLLFEGVREKTIDICKNMGKGIEICFVCYMLALRLNGNQSFSINNKIYFYFFEFCLFLFEHFSVYE